MAAQRWLILDADGVVQNVVLWDVDENPEWTPPEGCTMQLDDGNIVAVTDVPDTPTEPTADDRIADAREALAGIDHLGARPTVADLVAVLAALRDALT